LEVNHGEFLYIIGKTGSGKSSLIGFMLIYHWWWRRTHIVDFDLATLKENDIRFEEKK
jgi:cell division transport system ATP-binding protein